MSHSLNVTSFKPVERYIVMNGFTCRVLTCFLDRPVGCIRMSPSSLQLENNNNNVSLTSTCSRFFFFIKSRPTSIGVSPRSYQSERTSLWRCRMLASPLLCRRRTAPDHLQSHKPSIKTGRGRSAAERDDMMHEMLESTFIE